MFHTVWDGTSRGAIRIDLLDACGATSGEVLKGWIAGENDASAVEEARTESRAEAREIWGSLLPVKLRKSCLS